MEARPTIAGLNMSPTQEEAKRETSLDFAANNDINKTKGLGTGKIDDNLSMYSKD